MNMHDPEELQGQYRSFRRNYELQNIQKSDLEEFKALGWSIDKKNTKSIRVKKEKNPHVFSLHQVWNLIYDFGPKLINSNIPIELYSEKEGDLLICFDCLSFDEEVVLGIISLSGHNDETQVKKKTCFDQIKENKLKINNTLHKSDAHTKKKIAIIIWTNAHRLSDKEKEFLDKYNVVYLNENDLSYYKELVNHLGSIAKYQIYARLFSNLDIPELKNRIPAIRGYMGGYQYYSFAIEPSVLLKIAYVLHRTSTSEETLHTYQRMVKKNRVKEITSFIDNKGFFPNSIIINIDTKKGKSLQFDLAQTAEHDTSTTLGILHLPKSFRSAFIIDGQHRLLGYGSSDYKFSNSIPVVAFENLPPEIQSKLFIEINNNQKSVSKNLLLALDAELKWNSSNQRAAISALQSKLIQFLSEKEESPLFNRIITGEGKESSLKCITQTFITSYGFNRTSLIVEFNGHKITKLGPLWGGDFEKNTLNKAYLFFLELFSFVRERLPEQWDKGKAHGGFIAKNVGIAGLILIVDDLLKYIGVQGNYNYSEMSALEISSLIKVHIGYITDHLFSLNEDNLYKFGAHRGSSGPNIVRREFQKIINSNDPDFIPDGFIEFMQKSTGQYTDLARELVLSLQVKIKDYIFGELRAHFGEDNWWDDGVPKNIRKSCAERRIEDDSKDPDWNFIDLIHYESIIKQNWDLLGDDFTIPGSEKSAKDKRTGWFTKLNDIRKRVMHPERGAISKEEYEELSSIGQWLLPRIE